MKGLFNTVIIFVVLVFCERFPMPEAWFSSDNKTTLTTAKQRGSASPIPTHGSVPKLKRRVELDDQDASTQNNLEIPQFRARAHERNEVENVWDWDFWCQLQPKTGKCSESEEKQGLMKQRYYYDAVLDACKPFRFSGCDGNKNNFKTLVECELHCKEAVYMTLKETSNTSYCALQPNSGSCMTLLQRFYYDVRTGECKKFTYGGCGGNQNRFETSTQCNKRCKPDK